VSRLPHWYFFPLASCLWISLFFLRTKLKERDERGLLELDISGLQSMGKSSRGDVKSIPDVATPCHRLPTFSLVLDLLGIVCW